MNNKILLIKFPSRERPQKFFQVLDLYYSMAKNIDDLLFVITLDEDDHTMNNESVIKKLNTYKNLTYHFGTSKTKIQAVNADVPEDGWDILLLASDDMIPIVPGYDEIIRQCMEKDFPDTDGVLWFFDGHRHDLNTLCILGKAYYDRFGYIYYPDYITWWADNEFMYVSRLLGKESAYNECIIEHRHPVWTKKGRDELFRKENSLVLTNKDKALYELRERNKFFIMKKKLSLLVCTIEKRKKLFDRLIHLLQPQLNDDVELLFLSDTGKATIGEKRNVLLQSAVGEYVCFVDDDDRVSEDYVSQLMKGIDKGVDCCSLIGRISFNGRYPKLFRHSIKYKEYSESKVEYFRPPNHLNCIKSSIAKQFTFPELNRNEDTNWAMQIADAGVLKTEHEIDKVIYFYDYVSKK